MEKQTIPFNWNVKEMWAKRPKDILILDCGESLTPRLVVQPIIRGTLLIRKQTRKLQLAAVSHLLFRKKTGKGLNKSYLVKKITVKTFSLCLGCCDIQSQLFQKRKRTPGIYFAYLSHFCFPQVPQSPLPLFLVPRIRIYFIFLTFYYKTVIE